MSMTLDEMKLAVCEKLPELIYMLIGEESIDYYWIKFGCPIYWLTEGLQVCHEAEKLLNWPSSLSEKYYIELAWVAHRDIPKTKIPIRSATYEQRLEALCRVWFPEKWKD